MISYITSGDDVQVAGSLSVLATLLQTKGYIAEMQISLHLLLITVSLPNSTSVKLTQLFLVTVSDQICTFVELDESMLDSLGILPQRKQHKKLLLVCHSS